MLGEDGRSSTTISTGCCAVFEMVVAEGHDARPGMENDAREEPKRRHPAIAGGHVQGSRGRLQHAPPWGGEHVGCDPFDVGAAMKEDSRPRSGAVLGTERAKVSDVTQAWAFGCLDLDGQQVVSGFDDEIDLLTRCCSPVQDFGALRPGVPPRQQVPEHEVLEVRDGRLVELGEVQGGRGVAPVQLGRLDEPLGAVDRVGRHPHKQM